MVCLSVLVSFPNQFLLAQTTPSTAGPISSDLESKISARRSDIESLEIEIAKDKAEIARLGGEKKSLQSDIAILDLNKKTLTKEISVTQNKIFITDSIIRQLALGISEKEYRRQKSIGSLADTIKGMYRADDVSFTESLLTAGGMSQYWQDVDEINRIQIALNNHLIQIKTIKEELETKKVESEKKRAELATYKAELADKKSIVEYNQKEKNKLLASTGNKESAYKKVLADKLKKKEAFEQELLNFETQLKLINDPSLLPQAGKLLSWPLASFVLTQEFGDTAFARSRPGLYSGAGHNGIDLRAPIGTPIKSAGSGVVEGIGDTDTVCPGASYGKWVLVRHNNGLSTLYAHLSLIKVSAGTQVEAGDLLGYAGITGYTTGPHLHFTVYATQGVKIMDRPSKACGGTYRMPVADLRAYLNPMLYF
jgi:murein DD-endopeptidase MepM/ murein hydrolase activator NlpD